MIKPFIFSCFRFPQVEIPDELKDPSPSQETQGNATQIVAENSKVDAVNLQTTTTTQNVAEFESQTVEASRTDFTGMITVEDNSSSYSIVAISEDIKQDQELEIVNIENKVETT